MLEYFSDYIFYKISDDGLFKTETSLERILTLWN